MSPSKNWWSQLPVYFLSPSIPIVKKNKCGYFVFLFSVISLLLGEMLGHKGTEVVTLA